MQRSHSAGGGAVLRGGHRLLLLGDPAFLSLPFSSSALMPDAQVPVGVYFAWCRAKTRRRKVVVLCVVLLVLLVPVGRCSLIKRLRLWDTWLEYLHVEVRGTRPVARQSLFAFVPHGVFPFGLALAAVGRLNKAVFNNFRPIVASATKLFPVFGHLIKSLDPVDASAKDIHLALSRGDSVGLHPGGIGEMFWGYPRPGTSPNEEYALLRDRKGFIRMAIAHQVPVVPVYVFGASKLFKRMQLPAMVEALSRRLQASLVLFWGRWGSPIPFQVPLLYAVGPAIEPPFLLSNAGPTQEQVDAMHKQFCEAISQLFERYKAHYGWAHKTLRVV